MYCLPGLPAQIHTETATWPALETGERSPSPLFLQLCNSPPQGGSIEPCYFGSNKNWNVSPAAPWELRPGKVGPLLSVQEAFYTEYLAKSLLSNTTCVAK